MADRICARKWCPRTTDDPKWALCYPCWAQKRDAHPDAEPCPECGWPTSPKERSETRRGFCRGCWAERGREIAAFDYADSFARAEASYEDMPQRFAPLGTGMGEWANEGPSGGDE